MMKFNVHENLGVRSNTVFVEKISPANIQTLAEKPRVASIDIMRGIVMVIMALDHTRDFFHTDTALYQPTDLDKTYPLLFFTRIITHFCAPTFVFLSGISASISRQRKSVSELSIFLATRGLWLIVLEFTVIRFSLVFNWYYDFILFQVIWVMGASMIVLAALIYLPQRIILIIGLFLIFGHNLLDSIQLKPGNNGYAWWALIQQTGSFTITSKNFCDVAYPLIPWQGIMVTGYGMGVLYDPKSDDLKRRKTLLYAGIVAIVLFIMLRFMNGYGDPSLWSVQKNGTFTFMSFLNVTKYPVSLLYILMTLGPVLIILSWMERWRKNVLEPIRIIGRVPLFYYIVHFYLIHFSSLYAYMITSGTSWSEIDFHINKGFGGIPPGAGYALGWVYLAWILIVVALYPACKWYYNYKSTHKHWWLSYV